MKNRSGYDHSAMIRVRGLEGAFSGCEKKVRLGETIFVGRSNVCDVHPKANGHEDLATLCKKMSRKHMRVSFCNPEHIEVEDLSMNGTFFNGKRIDRIVLKDLIAGPAVFDLLGGTVVVENV